MFQSITTVLVIIAIALSFFNIAIAWILLSLLTIFFLFLLYSVKNKRYPYIHELSEAANKLLQQHGHFYEMPFASRDFSKSCDTIAFTGLVIIVISWYQGGAWWNILIATILYLLNWFASRMFNPIKIMSESDKILHNEIAEWLQRR